jgi:hypothetical protein
MDIFLPSLQRQSAAAPWRLVQQPVDRRALVENVRRELPGATADWIVAQLARSGVEVSGNWVAHWLCQPPELAAPTWPRIVLPASAPSNHEADSAEQQQASLPAQEGEVTDAISKAQSSALALPANSTQERRERLLNRFVERMVYSLARYLQEARPWIGHGDQKLGDLIQQMAADQERLAGQVAELIIRRRERLRHGQYPSRYSRYNDLAVRYVASEVLNEQKKLLDELESCLPSIAEDQEAADIVAAALVSQRRLTGRLEAALHAPSVSERHDERRTRVTKGGRTDERAGMALPSTVSAPVTAA